MEVISTFCLYVFVVLIGFGIMIFGWGLQPVSWCWIIGGTVANLVVLGFITIINK